jgi:hypothetical protein
LQAGVVKRGRGRPRKGEGPNAHLIHLPENDVWRKAQTDMIRLRAMQFAELASIEERKLSLLEEIETLKAKDQAERERLHMEYIDDLARLKLKKMTELEAYLEHYRDECFAGIQADFERQRAINAQRAAEWVAPTPAPKPRTVLPASAFVPPADEPVTAKDTVFKTPVVMKDTVSKPPIIIKDVVSKPPVVVKNAVSPPPVVMKDTVSKIPVVVKKPVADKIPVPVKSPVSKTPAVVSPPAPTHDEPSRRGRGRPPKAKPVNV